MDRLEEFVINNVKLGTHEICVEVLYDPNCTVVGWRYTYILTPSRPRLPLSSLSSILEPRLKDAHMASPWMGINEVAVRQITVGPQFIRR